MVPADARAEVVLLRNGAEVASWPLLCEGGAVDLRSVEALARIQLTARRQGCTVWFRRACPNLVELVDLVGLAGLLQVDGQPESVEQGGVEEVVVADDPVA